MNEAPASLLERTRQLLRSRPRGVTLKDVAEGSGLAFTFVHGMARNETTEPGVSKTQKLYEYLSGRKLEL